MNDEKDLVSKHLQYAQPQPASARKASVLEQFVQELACRAHERLALQIFVLSRRLAYHENTRMRIAGAEHDLRARFAQIALSAPLH